MSGESRNTTHFPWLRLKAFLDQPFVSHSCTTVRRELEEDLRPRLRISSEFIDELASDLWLGLVSFFSNIGLETWTGLKHDQVRLSYRAGEGQQWFITEGKIFKDPRVLYSLFWRWGNYEMRGKNLPNTLENPVLGTLRLQRELVWAGSNRLKEKFSGFLLQLTDPETGSHPAGAAPLRPGQDQTLRILLPPETGEVWPWLGVTHILDKLLAGSAEEGAEMFWFPDVPTVNPVPTHPADYTSLKLSGLDFATFVHQSTANRVDGVLFQILNNGRKFTNAPVVLLNLLTEFNQTSLLQFLE